MKLEIALVFLSSVLMVSIDFELWFWFCANVMPIALRWFSTELGICFSPEFIFDSVKVGTVIGLGISKLHTGND